MRVPSYGERVLTLEPGGIELIPGTARHGTARSLLWTWASPNLEFATMYVGVLAITVFGGALWPTCLALLIGTAIGAVMHGFLSTAGPLLGAAQLVQSRLAFGRRGARLPALLNAVTAGAGWVAVNSVSGAFALTAFCSVARLPVPSIPVALAIIVAIEMLIAGAGHNLVHAVQRLLLPFLAVVFGGCVALIATRARSTADGPSIATATGGSTGAFILTLFAALAYAVSWNPYASDYSRYLPRDVPRRRVALMSGSGLFLSCAVLEIGGALLATIPGTRWGPSDNPTQQLVDQLPYWLALITPLAICAGAVCANVLNLYSAAMSALVAGVRLPTRHRRAALSVTFAAVGLAVALSGSADPGTRYTSLLFLSTYWVLPWAAVVLADIRLRHGPGDVAVLEDRHRRRAAGVVAMVAGIAASIPFMNQPVFTGWVAAAWPQTGDLSLIAGPGVAAAVYGLLWRSGRSPRDTLVAGRPINRTARVEVVSNEPA